MGLEAGGGHLGLGLALLQSAGWLVTLLTQYMTGFWK